MERNGPMAMGGIMEENFEKNVQERVIELGLTTKQKMKKQENMNV